MIYECPNCRTPQEAGQTVCPQCRAEFDGPVPGDAVVPLPAEVQAMSEAAPSAEAALVDEAEPGADVAPKEAVSAAQIEAMRPQAEASPQAETPAEAPPNPSAASSSQPYLTAPSLSPLPYTAPAAGNAPSHPFSRLSQALLIAFPVVLILVLGSVFYANSLNAGSDTVPATPPAPAVQSSPLPAPSASTGTPTVLQGAGNADNGADDPHAKMLVGRWAAVSGDFYLFNSDGSGSRGNPVKQQKEQTFLWGLVQNRIMLYRDQNEMLRFNAGPDDNTIFLAAQSGHYVQFTRSKT